MPVPIGDPEKSRIDPDLSGMWLLLMGDLAPAVALFEPYDKRTWLIAQFPITVKEESCDWFDDGVVEGEDEYELDFDPPDDDAVVESDGEDEVDFDPPDDDAVVESDGEDGIDYDFVVRKMEAHGADCYGGESVAHYKAWRTKLGGKWFMTWEPKGLYDEDFGFVNEMWLGWRIDKAGSDRFSLKMIDWDYDGFDDLEDAQEIADTDPPFDPRTFRSARREVERLIRKNTDDDDLYSGTFELFRVQPEHFNLFEGTITSPTYDMFDK